MDVIFCSGEDLGASVGLPDDDESEKKCVGCDNLYSYTADTQRSSFRNVPQSGHVRPPIGLRCEGRCKYLGDCYRPTSPFLFAFDCISLARQRFISTLIGCVSKYL